VGAMEAARFGELLVRQALAPHALSVALALEAEERHGRREQQEAAGQQRASGAALVRHEPRALIQLLNLFLGPLPFNGIFSQWRARENGLSATDSAFLCDPSVTEQPSLGDNVSGDSERCTRMPEDAAPSLMVVHRTSSELRQFPCLRGEHGA